MFIKELSHSELYDYLQQQGWLSSENEKISKVETAGDGNMNCILRVMTNTRSVIIKQGRSFCEAFPDIPAPLDRVRHEAKVLQLANKNPALSPYVPCEFGYDDELSIMCLQDFGQCQNMAQKCYSGNGVSREQIKSLIDFLNHFHHYFYNHPERSNISNHGMRMLRYETLFHMPLREEDSIDLDTRVPGFAQEAINLRSNEAYCKKVKELSQIQLYDGDGTTLLHGDFHPSNWLVMDPDDVRIPIIDFEGGYLGRPELEVGTLIGQLLFGLNNWRAIDYVCANYKIPGDFDWLLALRFAGIEIMGRQIGVTQLPVQFELEHKKELLALSEMLVLEPQAFDDHLQRRLH